jgi:uncharacterized OB-fold protein
MSANLQAGHADWTTGVAAIGYQSCASCPSIWYFRRGFCPSCGTPDPLNHHAAGTGIVHAITVLHRAATPEARAHIPFAILLVDADEGFRMMAHGDRDLKIGDRVGVRFDTFIDRLIPYFSKTA